jgi:hypothetical protein
LTIIFKKKQKKSPLLPRTLGTQPIEFKAVTADFEAVLPGHFLLQLFDAEIFEFDDGATSLANQVVVMLLAAGGFVSRLPVPEVARLGNPGIGKEPEGPINGGITDIGVFFPQSQIEFFGGKVGSGAEELVQNNFPLPGRFQPLLRQILPKRSFNLRHRPTTLIPPATARGVYRIQKFIAREQKSPKKFSA